MADNEDTEIIPVIWTNSVKRAKEDSVGCRVVIDQAVIIPRLRESQQGRNLGNWKRAKAPKLIINLWEDEWLLQKHVTWWKRDRVEAETWSNVRGQELQLEYKSSGMSGGGMKGLGLSSDGCRCRLEKFVEGTDQGHRPHTDTLEGLPENTHWRKEGKSLVLPWAPFYTHICTLKSTFVLSDNSKTTVHVYLRGSCPSYLQSTEPLPWVKVQMPPCPCAHCWLCSCLFRFIHSLTGYPIT